MPASLITSKGQTTIPQKIRKYLRIQPGDRIDFVVDDQGKVVIEPSTLDIKELEGLLHRQGMKTVSIAEMKRSIRKRFEKNRR